MAPGRTWTPAAQSWQESVRPPGLPATWAVCLWWDEITLFVVLQQSMLYQSWWVFKVLHVYNGFPLICMCMCVPAKHITKIDGKAGLFNGLVPRLCAGTIGTIVHSRVLQVRWAMSKAFYTTWKVGSTTLVIAQCTSGIPNLQPLIWNFSWLRIWIRLVPIGVESKAYKFSRNRVGSSGLHPNFYIDLITFVITGLSNFLSSQASVFLSEAFQYYMFSFFETLAPRCVEA